MPMFAAKRFAPITILQDINRFVFVFVCFVFCGEQSYQRVQWNVLDCLTLLGYTRHFAETVLLRCTKPRPQDAFYI